MPTNNTLSSLLFLHILIFITLLSFPRPMIAIAEANKTSTQIVLLGTGTPTADPLRSGPSVAIMVNNTPYLIDFGPGVVRRASAAYGMGIKGLWLSNLKHAFVTHLHSDHTAGYADLILSPWVLGRNTPLKVFGPKGIVSMTDHILAAYEEDIRVRVEGLESVSKDGYKVIAHEIERGVVYKDLNVTVEAFPVSHGSWPLAFGYKFRTPDKTIVISGDTAPSESTVKACNGCDVLIHEVYSKAGFERHSPGGKRYNSSFHTSTDELARLALKAKPKLLILYHQLFWGTTEEELLSEIRQIYKGKVVSGKDLDVY
jgi:ribonuclease BN (tRNA processing enzyme)